MKDKELSAFKDGVADALLEGYASDWHENLHYYKQGYDFGLKMYSEYNKLDKEQRLKMKDNEWLWDSIDIELTNPKGETVILKSKDLRDSDMTSLFEIIQHYVDKQGGELA